MTADIRVAGDHDLAFLGAHDQHIARGELDAVVSRGRVLVAVDGGTHLGWLRWGLFWDEVPFMNLLFVVEAGRGRGLGRLLVDDWGARMRHAGRARVMTSTLSDESAQHFYRHLGYRDFGALLLPGEATELMLLKELTGR
ncbi:GNAT family N-acetyltransferase [Occultella glacieicola]|uniref:GNAT family N-acetyltransferase n=1 Tax=Occultella glacieicola TaxID=2518684 RepID=A0ABY2E440_9MICO|nr:GNAT family N-acetyltransferase [Occultella glacieicola]TDE94787.1 GNAT family N-acetyltransferase [Occultella glacieicola]